jgi:hypothetical protein
VGTVHEFKPLALGEMRVENALVGLNEVERACVLGWAVARTLRDFPDPKRASLDFLSDLWAKMAALSVPAKSTSQE